MSDDKVVSLKSIEGVDVADMPLRERIQAATHECETVMWKYFRSAPTAVVLGVYEILKAHVLDDAVAYDPDNKPQRDIDYVSPTDGDNA